MAWRSDEATMETVFELMRLKFSHPGYRHETLPERETGVILKLRWKVMSPEGRVVVLQRPFRQTVALTGAQIRQAVAEQTAKKVPGAAPFDSVSVVEADGKRRPVDEGETRLAVEFPGPKFEALRLVKLECMNAAMAEFEKTKPERAERHRKKLEEDKVRVEQRKAAAREAKNAEAAAQGPAAGRGRGRGAAPKAAAKGPAKAGAKAGAAKGAKKAPAKGRGRGAH